MQRKVGIILVNYNGFADTVDCVNSLKKIIYQNYEIIIVDNASSAQVTADQTDILRENCVYIESRENLGFSGGNNLGIERAIADQCDYVCLLNNDTTVEPDFLNVLVAEAESHPEAGILCGKIPYYYEPNKIWYAGGEFDFRKSLASHTSWNEIDSDFSKTTRQITFATGCLMLMPVPVIQKLGGMSEDFFLYAEDTDLCCKVMKAGHTIRYCNAAVIYHKINSSTGTGSPLSQYYICRNGLVIIHRYSTSKLYSYLYYAYRNLKDIIFGRKKLGIVLRAYKDYFRGNLGKTF